MPMLSAAIRTTPSSLCSITLGDGGDDFGETENEEQVICDDEEVPMSALAGKLMASLSLSKSMPPGANECFLSEVIAQWDALSHREKDPSYKISAAGVGWDFVENHRSRISSFFFSIIDHMELDRRIVSVALSYLKRYLARRPEGRSKAFRQLCMITSLYVAIKIHSSNICHNGRHNNITIAEVVGWSGNVFTTEDVSRMEASMLSTLDFYMNPPVAQHFLDIIAPLIDANNIDPQLKQHIITTSHWLCEASVTDSYLTGVKPSSVAYAAILVAMDTTSSSSSSDEGASSVKGWFESLEIKHDAYTTLHCYEKMFELYYLQDESTHEGSCYRCLSPTEVAIRNLGM